MRRRLAGRGDAGEALDLKLLERLGTRLGAKPKRLEGKTIRQFLVEKLLRVRTKQGEIKPLLLNRAQQEYEGRCGRRNIVLKARQLGITTYVAARFFVHTITRRGTLSVQVAHNQDSAEEIFRIVHRFLENLPERLQAGALCTSRANVRQVVFPRLDSEYRVETAADPNAGRGMTIQNLHCSEVARWPGDGAETLAGLRAAVPPGGEIVLESTANGAPERFMPSGRGRRRRAMCGTSFPGGGSRVIAGRRWDRRAERGRSGAGGAVRAGRGADRVPEGDASELRSAICGRVRGRRRELFSRQRRMRL